MLEQSEGTFLGTHVREDESCTERELIQRILDGEQNLFRILVSRNKDIVFSMVMRQTGQRELAEELAHEIFIKGYKQLKNFRGEAKFSTWLIRIAINHTHSYYSSKRYKQQERTESFELGSHDMSTESPHDTAERAELIRQFRSCLTKLTPKFKEIIVLCGLEGKSYEEAAQLVEVPVGTVRSRLNKARLLLKDCMEQA